MSVCESVRAQFGVKDGHYRSKGFVCVSVISRAYADNLADGVDRLLIIIYRRTLKKLLYRAK